MAEGQMRELPTDRVDLWVDARSLIPVSTSPYWDAVDEALTSLSPQDSYILLSRTIEKLTWEQMAERFGMSRTTVQRKCEKAAEKLLDNMNLDFSGNY